MRPVHCVKKFPNMELFLVRISPHSDWIRRDTSYLSVFSPNAWKYRPEITPYLDTFHAVYAQKMRFSINDQKHNFLFSLNFIIIKKFFHYNQKSKKCPVIRKYISLNITYIQSTTLFKMTIYKLSLVGATWKNLLKLSQNAQKNICNKNPFQLRIQ